MVYLKGVVEVVHAHPLALVTLQPPERLLPRAVDSLLLLYRRLFPATGHLFLLEPTRLSRSSTGTSPGASLEAALRRHHRQPPELHLQRRSLYNSYTVSPERLCNYWSFERVCVCRCIHRRTLLYYSYASPRVITRLFAERDWSCWCRYLYIYIYTGYTIFFCSCCGSYADSIIALHCSVYT